MRILVEVSCEWDPTLNVRIDRASGGVVTDPGDELMRVSHGGRRGIDFAVLLAPTEIIAFAVGAGHEQALTHALAAGAHQAVALHGHPTGAALTAWLVEQDPNLVIADKTIACCAASLRWSHVAGALSAKVVAGKVVVLRSLGRGERERVEARLPAVLRLDPEGKPRYLARSRMAAIRDRAISYLSLEQTVERGELERGPLQPARPRTRLGGQIATATSTSASGRLQALMGLGHASKTMEKAPPPELPLGSDEQAESFVRYLAHHQLLELRSQS